MDQLRSLIEALKTTTYELLAVVLPGTVVLYAAQVAFLDVDLSTPILIIGGYASGMALQGTADFLLSRKRVRKWLGTDLTPWEEAERAVESVLKETTKVDVPRNALFDVCLSRLETRRQVYDKFVALRDGARGMAIATFLVSFTAGWHWRAPLNEGALPFSILKWAALIVSTAIITLAFLQRYRKFCSLPTRVVYGQYLALLVEDSRTAIEKAVRPSG